MEDHARLKIKVGEHEFEAEGPAEVVQAQFAAFKELVTLVPAAVTSTPVPVVDAAVPAPKTDPATADAALDKIMRADNRIVALTVRPRSAEEAVLLILYGQRTLRGNDSVTGSEVVEGLERTGGLAINRPDRLLEKAHTDGDVIVIGERRRKRYRLTLTGLTKARTAASELIALVA